jgi:hypothetical protein
MRGDERGGVCGRFDETPEGHAVRYGADGELVGITIVDARRLLDENGAIRNTRPEMISAAVLGPVLAAPEARTLISLSLGLQIRVVLRHKFSPLCAEDSCRSGLAAAGPSSLEAPA